MIFARVTNARDYTGQDIEEPMIHTAQAEANSYEDGMVTLSLCGSLTHPHEDTWGYELDLDPDNAQALGLSLLNASAKARKG